MKIAIVGGGAIGAFVGVRLARASETVTCIGAQGGVRDVESGLDHQADGGVTFEALCARPLIRGMVFRPKGLIPRVSFEQCFIDSMSVC